MGGGLHVWMVQADGRKSWEGSACKQVQRTFQVELGTGYRPLPHRHRSVEILSQQCVAIMLSPFRVVNYQSRIPGQEFYTDRLSWSLLGCVDNVWNLEMRRFESAEKLSHLGGSAGQSCQPFS